MRKLIEEYRNWEIFFDTASEDFYSVCNLEDTQVTKKSYSATKKYIDDYLKANNTFKPFKVQSFNRLNEEYRVFTIIGIRKDNAFIAEDSKGIKRQMSKWDEKDYFLLDESNSPIFKTIKEKRTEYKRIEEELYQLEKQIKKVTLNDIKKGYITE